MVNGLVSTNWYTNGALLINFTVGKVDCYGIPRNNHGKAALKPFLRGGVGKYSLRFVMLVFAHKRVEKYEAGDALVWTELDGYPCMPFRALEGPAFGLFNPNNPQPTGLFMTSPNMDFIPSIIHNTNQVWIRQNGRYFVHDFTLYPQWYFEGTYYMPFVFRRPSVDALDAHEYALAWYDLKQQDFQREGRGDVQVGKLRQDLIDGLKAMRLKLSDLVNLLVKELDPSQVNEMRHSQRGMWFASIALDIAAQDNLMTLLTFTSFQRHFLETLACYTYFKEFAPRRFTGNVDPHPVDLRLMGTFTCSLQVAQDMHQLGVPFWLVRRPVGISKNMNVGSNVNLRDPDEHCVRTIFAGTIRAHNGPPTAVRNRVCQTLRIENIQIDHSAYHGMKAGDDFAPVAGLMPGN